MTNSMLESNEIEINRSQLLFEPKYIYFVMSANIDWIFPAQYKY